MKFAGFPHIRWMIRLATLLLLAVWCSHQHHFLFFTIFPGDGDNSNDADDVWDVVVYGATPAGIAAATAAATLGMRVAILEPLPMIGGMGAAGNLGLHDGAQTTSLTGLALQFAMLNARAYNVFHPVPQAESFVSNASFHTMLEQAGVAKLELGCRLIAATPAYYKSAITGEIYDKVDSIAVTCEPNLVRAHVFIDASYDGDIMTNVGTVDYSFGRESSATYNETLAGARIPTDGRIKVNALCEDGRTLLKYVQNLSELAAPGQADDALMAFQHRFCISGDKDNKVEWKKPKGYRRDDFLLFERYINASGGKFHGFKWPPQNMHAFGYPGAKDKYTLCCGITIAASDQPNLNRGWATATWERKQEIIADHVYFELGMFYFLAHDPSVPARIRADFQRYGLCADEFVEYDYIPPQLYIRESNRLVGDFVMTQNNIGEPRYVADSIATNHWWMDMHMTGKYAVPNATDGSFYVQLEGNFPQTNETSPPPYDIPYRLMIPKPGTGTNLLIPVCLSASHAAFGSTRIESMLMGTGTAAGVAATQLVHGIADTVQEVDVAAVQSILVHVFQQRIHVD